MSLKIADIELSNPHKVLYPDLGLTKADLARYYELVIDRMFPLVKDRLLSVVRCPDGLSGKSWYEKHCRQFPKAMKLVQVLERGSGHKAAYACVTGLESLVAGVQMGVLEFHIWGSRANDLERPDRVVLDIDPGEGITFEEVKGTAFELRRRLEASGLKSVPLLTGGKGIHVVVPLVPDADWKKAHEFSKDIAKRMEEDQPKKYVTKAGKEKRKGLIFIDYLRNGRGATAVAPYSTRNLKGAPVAAPVSWEELSDVKSANTYNVKNMSRRVTEADPWEESYKWRQKLP